MVAGISGVSGSGVSLFDPSPRDRVVVNRLDDFPAPEGGNIFFEPDANYLIGQSVSSPFPFILNGANFIESVNPLAVLLTYTGTGNMFSGSDVSPTFFNMGFSCSLAKLINIQDTGGTVGSNSLRIANCFLSSCDTIADMTSLRSLIVDGFQVNQAANGGFKFFGTNWDGPSIRNCAIRLLDGKCYDFGSVAFRSCALRDFRVDTTTSPNAVGITGTTSSGNMVAGAMGAIDAYTFLGSGTDSTFVTPSDVRWGFNETSNIDAATTRLPSVKAIDITLGSPQAVAAAQSVFTAIGSVSWTSNIAERFTFTTAGVVTYIGEDDARFFITGRTTQLTGGVGFVLTASRICINGTALSESESSTESNRPTTTSPSALKLLSNGDTVELVVANLDNADGIQVNSANLIIINGF